MGYVEKLLAQEERIIFVTRLHWLNLLTTVLIDGVIAVVLVALVVAGLLLSGTPLPALGLVLLLVPLAHLGLRIAAWYSEQYVVTNRRVIEIKGAFNKYVSDSSLEMVNDVIMEQSALGRLLNFGDIRIITGSDSGINTFRRIAQPIRLKTLMLDQKSHVGGTMETSSEVIDPAQVPELLEKLDDLRQRGVLSEEEFEREKRQLLNRLK